MIFSRKNSNICNNPKMFFTKKCSFPKMFFAQKCSFPKMLGFFGASLTSYYIHKTLWQCDVLHSDGGGEEWCDFAVLEAGYAAADARNVEYELGVLFGKFDELIDVWADGLNAALHCRYGVRLSLQADALSEDCAKFFFGNSRRAAVMVSLEIAAEYKHFVCSELRDAIWSDSLIYHNFVSVNGSQSYKCFRGLEMIFLI